MAVEPSFRLTEICEYVVLSCWFMELTVKLPKASFCPFADPKIIVAVAE
jgi:hypothetical protein